MVAENPAGRAPRIHGELQMLGFEQPDFGSADCPICRKMPLKSAFSRSQHCGK
jgi:hypothetical protein